MANLSDYIEQYIKKLIQKNNSGIIEIQRNELAVVFDCVPSQINYVLGTRFTVEHGYVVESRRGGGGYIRIVRLNIGNDRVELLKIINQRLGVAISRQRALNLIQSLNENDIITQREASIMTAVIDKNIHDRAESEQDKIRVELLKAMLLSVIRYNR